MKSHAIFAAVALALSAAPILAQDTNETATQSQEQSATVQTASTTPVETAATAEPDPGEQVICRRDRATGSLTRVNRVCKTRNEWNASNARTRDNMDDMQRNASGGVACRQDQMGGC